MCGDRKRSCGGRTGDGVVVASPEHCSVRRQGGPGWRRPERREAMLLRAAAASAMPALRERDCGSGGAVGGWDGANAVGVNK
jgi:hypothetical protein